LTNDLDGARRMSTKRTGYWNHFGKRGAWKAEINHESKRENQCDVGQKPKRARTGNEEPFRDAGAQGANKG